MNLDLSDDETAEITQVLTDITGNDRYPFSERIRLRRSLAKLKPEPIREPLLRQKVLYRPEGPCPRRQGDR
jgi:hypothetical protein